jgi:hypothetical protein
MSPALYLPDISADIEPTCNLLSQQIDNLNADIVIKLVFAGFFRTKKITYKTKTSPTWPSFDKQNFNAEILFSPTIINILLFSYAIVNPILIKLALR